MNPRRAKMREFIHDALLNHKASCFLSVLSCLSVCVSMCMCARRFHLKPVQMRLHVKEKENSSGVRRAMLPVFLIESVKVCFVESVEMGHFEGSGCDRKNPPCGLELCLDRSPPEPK